MSNQAAQNFYQSIYGVMGVQPYWMGAVKAKPQVPDFKDPNGTVQAVVMNDRGASTWKDAAKRALMAVNPFYSIGPVSNAVAHSTKAIGDSGSRFVKDAAESVREISGGVSKGFKWGTFAVVILLGMWIISWLPRKG